MKGSDLVRLGEQYPDFDFEFQHTELMASKGTKQFRDLKVLSVDTNAKVVTLTSNVVRTRY